MDKLRKIRRHHWKQRLNVIHVLINCQTWKWSGAWMMGSGSDTSKVAKIYRCLYGAKHVCARHHTILTIRQRRRPWKRRWKINSASYQTISRLSQIPVTKTKAIYVGAEKRGPPPSSDRDGRIYRLPFPSSKKLKIWLFHVVVVQRDGKEMYKKAWCPWRVVLLTKPIGFWRGRCRRRRSFVSTLI